MLFEQLTAVRLGDADRTRTLRHRYLALQLAPGNPARFRWYLAAPVPLLSTDRGSGSCS
jgi:hypothetical protein